MRRFTQDVQSMARTDADKPGHIATVAVRLLEPTRPEWIAILWNTGIADFLRRYDPQIPTWIPIGLAPPSDRSSVRQGSHIESKEPAKSPEILGWL
jgi:hypothetical protein